MIPHKANVGEIVRTRSYPDTLFIVMEYTEEVSHEIGGASDEVVTYTCRNIDNHKEIKIIFDEDIISIVATADKADAFIARRQGKTQPPAIRDKKVQIDLAGLLKHFEEEKNRREQSEGKPNENNAPRSPWAKEREAKRIAYEYIDFLLERYAALVAMQEIMPHDKEIDAEIELVREEFMEKSGEDVIQDGKFS